MKSARGSNLRAVPVQPNTEQSDSPPELTPNQSDAMAMNSGMDELQNLPDAPKAMPIAPGAGGSNVHRDDDDLDKLPDAGGQLGQVYGVFSHGDPDHVAKVLDASKKLGADPAQVADNLKDAEKAAKGPDGNFFQDIENRFPGTTKYLQAPQNMAVAHDDIPNLAKHEELIQGITHAMDIAGALKTGWAAGWQGSVLGMKSRGKMPDTVLPEDAPVWGRLAAMAGGLAGDFTSMIPGAAAGAEAGASIGAMAGGLIGAPIAGVGAIPGAMAGSALGAFLGGGAGAFAAPATMKEFLRQKYELGDVKGVADAMDRGGMILKAATKQGLVGIVTSAAGGLVAAPFESAAAKALLPSIFESQALKATAPLVAENVAMTKAGNAVEGKETNPQDYLDNALMIAAMHGATHMGARAAEHYIEAKKASQAVQFYDGLGETGGASKLLQRLPEEYQAMLGGLTKDSPVENIHIPQEAFNQYFQSKNVDPLEAAKELGVSDAYLEAQATGGNVTIPTEEFVSKVVRTEHYQGLKDDIKFDPEGLTVNEVKSRQAEIQEQINQADVLAQAGGENPTPEESTQKIYDERYQQLIDAGRTPQEAKMGATLQSRAFHALAERTGQDPYELAKRFQLEVQKRESADGSIDGQAFNQDGKEKPDIAEFFEGQDAVDRYNAFPDAKEGMIVSQDLARRLYEPYAEDKEGATIHLDSTSEHAQKMAERLYDERLKAPGNAPVVLMAGGTASGKTSYQMAMGHTWKDLTAVVDSTGANYKVMKENIEKARAAGKPVLVSFIFRPFDKALEGNAKRFHEMGRLVPPNHMAYSHVAAMDTFLRLAKEYSGTKDVDFEAHDNSGIEIEKPKAISVDELEALRYNKAGESVNSATKSLKADAKKRLENELEEVRKIKQAAEARDLERGNQGPGGSEGKNESQSSEGRLGEGSESNLKKLDQPTDEGPRGRITFQNEKAIIDLFKDANRSTFLHESGHYFLEIMGHLANEETAPQSIKDDMKTIRDWMGLKEGEAIGTEQHEQFARGFEAYLMEGKAPSSALTQAFSKFKQWLVHIYKSVQGLNVELSPEIRAVMDRMVATDEEIKVAHESIGFNQVSGSDIPAPVKSRFENLVFQSREEAESELMKEQMKELSSERKSFLEDERSRLTEEAKKQVSEEPVYQAVAYIKDQVGPRKNIESMAKKFLEGKLKDQDAVHFETAAEMQGVFADGRELALNIINNGVNDHFNRAVHELVESGMAKHADLMDTSKIKARALELVHNEKLSELLELERNILADKIEKADVSGEVSKRNRIEARIAAKAARDQARESLNQKSVKAATNAGIYVTAERNAAAKAASATTRGDYPRAAEYKRQQMLNHALAAEAMKNRAVSEKAMGYLEDASKRKGDLKGMPYAFNRQVDQLLEKFGFKSKQPIDDTPTLLQIAKDMQGKGEEPLEIANATGMIIDPVSGTWRQENLRDFLSRVNDNYLGLQIPESVLSGASVTDPKDLKMGDLKDLRDSVKAITDIGKKYNHFLNEFIKIDMKEAAAQLKKSVLDLIGSPYAENRKIGQKFDSEWKQKFENLKNLPDAMIPTLVNTLTLCHYLDGGEQGPAHDFIYRPMKQAEDRKFARYAQMREDVSGKDGLFGKFYSPKELADYKKEATKFDGRSVTKENILAMALNWGNEANRDRIRAGYGSRDQFGRLIPMNDSDIQGLFKHLDKKDWDFAQATWDHLNTYWPEISALEMKMRGVEPARVESSPFVNEHGQYAGGYYPIAYEFEKSSEAFKNEQAKNELYKQYSASHAQTDSGHTQSRVSFMARPVRLSLDVLFNHLENVIHDLEFRPAIVDTNKFLGMPEVKKTLEDAIGMKAKLGLDTWLKSIASDQSENLTWLEKAMTWTRFGTTIAALGMTPKAFLLHAPSNVFNSMWEIGVKDTTAMMTRAALDMALGRGNLKDFVFSKSERMKQRLTIRDRDIMDMAKAWSKEADGTFGGLGSAIVGGDLRQARDEVAAMIPHYAFISLHLADEAVSVPLWAEIYKKNLAELGERGAKELADETVTRTLGSGSKVDQINLQKGHQTKKLFTMFYSWMSVMFNRAWLDGKMAGLEYKKDNVGSAAAILAKAAFFGFALPAVHEALLKQALTNGPQTDDEKKKQFIGTIVEYPFAMVPFLRDIAQLAIHKALGEHGGDMKISPVEQALQNIYSPVSDGARIAFTDGKHFDEKYAEEVARGMAQIMGYPQQLNTWAFNFWDYVQHNGEASMKDFLSRRRKK